MNITVFKPNFYMHYIKLRTVVIAIIAILFSCKKDKDGLKKDPSTYSEMFTNLGLQFNKEYKYEEWHTNNENGTGWMFTNRAGTVIFNLGDTTLTEKYKGFTSKDRFELSNFFVDYCSFKSYGFQKYDTAKSVFINNARGNINIKNNQTFIGWSTKINGVFSAYQLKITAL